jgi:hypothetical protein
MKKISLILVILCVLNSCTESKEPECTQARFQSVQIDICTGESDHFLKVIGGDSLFVHISTGSSFGHGFSQTMNDYSYIYYTKGSNVKSVSWETGGKYSEEITNVKVGQ